MTSVTVFGYNNLKSVISELAAGVLDLVLMNSSTLLRDQAFIRMCV